jgi:hypothetical protein
MTITIRPSISTTHRSGSVVSSLVSYSGGPVFKSEPIDRLSWQVLCGEVSGSNSGRYDCLLRCCAV